MKITYTVKSGRNVGVILTPHRYGDGTFRAHKTNSRSDPQGRRVKTKAELAALIADGYHVRMSNMTAGHAPSTVRPTTW